MAGFSEIAENSENIHRHCALCPRPVLKIDELLRGSLRNNLVFSYTYELPFDNLSGLAGKLVGGWKLSGITRFSDGLPVTLLELDDNSLVGTPCAGPNCNGIDVPNYTPGPSNYSDPRKCVNNPNCPPYFNTSLFTSEQLGQLGNALRRFFRGPGINNWDMALLKEFTVNERMHVEFRAEFFNVFNHTQFVATSGLGSPSTGTCVTSGPGEPCGGPGSPFGYITTARDPRIGQVALKFVF